MKVPEVNVQFLMCTCHNCQPGTGLDPTGAIILFPREVIEVVCKREARERAEALVAERRIKEELLPDLLRQINASRLVDDWPDDMIKKYHQLRKIALEIERARRSKMN